MIMIQLVREKWKKIKMIITYKVELIKIKIYTIDTTNKLVL